MLLSVTKSGVLKCKYVFQQSRNDADNGEIQLLIHSAEIQARLTNAAGVATDDNEMANFDANYQYIVFFPEGMAHLLY